MKINTLAAVNSRAYLAIIAATIALITQVTPATSLAAGPGGQMIKTGKRFLGNAVSCRVPLSGAASPRIKVGKALFNFGKLVASARSQAEKKRIRKAKKRFTSICRALACTITVDAPVLSVQENSNIEILPAIQASPTCGQLQAEVISNPARGQVAAKFQGTLPMLEYSVGFFSGSDTFAFRICQVTGPSCSQNSQATLQVSEKDFSGNSDSLLPYRDSLSEKELRAFLKSIAFAANEEAVQYGLTNGLTALVDALLSDSPQVDGNGALGADLAQQYNDTFRNYMISQGQCLAPLPAELCNHTDTVRITNLIQARYGSPLHEWLALIYWHNHFPANLRSLNSDSHRRWMIDYVDFLRESVFRPFEATLLSSYFDEALVNYINGDSNHCGRNPPTDSLGYFTGLGECNQNYPREFLELFTMGTVDPFTKLPNYTEDDVMSATMALSGLRMDSGFPCSGDQALPDPISGRDYFCHGDESMDGISAHLVFWSYHWMPEYVDPTVGSMKCWNPISHQPHTAGTLNLDFRCDMPLLDIPHSPPRPLYYKTLIKALLYEHHQTAVTIAHRLFSQLAHHDPTEAMIRNELVPLLLSSNYDIKALVRKILLSEAMFSSKNFKEGVASPVEVVMAFLRVFDIPMDFFPHAFNTTYLYLRDALELTSHDLLQPNSIFGWMTDGLLRNGVVYDGEGWLDAGPLIGTSRAIVIALNSIAHPSRENISIYHAVFNRFPQSAKASPQAVIEHIAKIWSLDLLDNEKSILAGYLTDNGAVPWSPANASYIQKKLAGLMTILSMHPENLKR